MSKIRRGRKRASSRIGSTSRVYTLKWAVKKMGSRRHPVPYKVAVARLKEMESTYNIKIIVTHAGKYYLSPVGITMLKRIFDDQLDSDPEGD